MKIVELSKRLKKNQPTLSQSANRGEKIARENRLNLFQSNQHMKERPPKILWKDGKSTVCLMCAVSIEQEYENEECVT